MFWIFQYNQVWLCIYLFDLLERGVVRAESGYEVGPGDVEREMSLDSAAYGIFLQINLFLIPVLLTM